MNRSGRMACWCLAGAAMVGCARPESAGGVTTTGTGGAATPPGTGGGNAGGGGPTATGGNPGTSGGAGAQSGGSSGGSGAAAGTDGGATDVATTGGAGGGGSGTGGAPFPGSGGGFVIADGGATDGAVTMTADPTTCAQAAQYKTYVGCDYWPTVVANNVWSIFDFAAVVANGQTTAATVTVTGPGNVNQTVTVAAGSLSKIFLPWVAALKGPEADSCGQAMSINASAYAAKGAYHLISTIPVTVYQFNPLEYQGRGGPTGKSWATCPGSQECVLTETPSGCLSFSNDASLLLPSTAMTGNYRIMGMRGWSETNLLGNNSDVMGTYFAITATQDNTTVDVKLSATGQALAGGAIPATAAGGVMTLKMQQGDVAEVTAPLGSKYDFSGSQVAADKPVQVLSGIPCIDIPAGKSACDHLEESVPPAETLGKHYVVTVPSGPNGTAVGHVVRIYGNVDATTLTYAPTKPAACPATINAGQVVDCGTVAADFDVRANNAFGVGMFQLASSLVDPNAVDVTRQRGDPSQSMAVAVEQYRTRYIFLAPDDYDISYVDITGSTGVKVTLDGAALTTPFTALGTTGYAVARVKLGAGKSGAHVMTSDTPVGIQVIGYGIASSYQYPGGLNLSLIAPPLPPIIK